MKKLVLASLLAVSSLSFALETHLRFGGVTTGKKYFGESAFENYSPAVGLEVTQSLLLFDVGAGIQYNGGNSSLDIDTVPAYLLARWNIIPIGIKPYVVAKAGKSIYSKEKVEREDPKATYYYGLGLGMNISFLQAELLYSVNKLDNAKSYDTLNQLSVMLGYRF